MSAPIRNLPLIAGAPSSAPLAWRNGVALTRGRYLAEVHRLAVQLPEGVLLAVTGNRYAFALALGAAVLRGQTMLMPPNHTDDMIQRLASLFPGAYALADDQAPPVELPTYRFPIEAIDAVDATPILLTTDTPIAHVLTSGSTGTPTQHEKRFGLLVTNVQAEAHRLASTLGRSDMQGVTVVGTVPPHHMYGFESTVLMPMLSGGAFAAVRPFFAADIARALAEVPRPRVLVITPFHLKSLLDAKIDLPVTDLTVSATAPLSPQLAARAEAALGGPLLEIYGCTEAGQIATRRTTQSEVWQTFGELSIVGDGEHCSVSGGHVPEPTPLADALEVLTPQTFRLLGRSNDLINVAGKRSSLSHLNFQLNSIEGVRDGAFWLPPVDSVEGVARPVAFVVAPGVTRDDLISELRRRIDPALVPRRIVTLTSLPRDPTGKLPSARLAELAAEQLARPSGEGA